ncbi:MAG TPA: carbohydrate kinase [Cytophagales bacterium]|jgi:xylulokinase|nr:carbohydrate kinase [Cytophagales bacterium]
MKSDGYLLGLDIGSSSVKAALVDIHSGKAVAQAQSPEHEMEIQSPHLGWAEQDPELWWQHVVISVKKCLALVDKQKVKAIGIGYQMHGLVIVDEKFKPLRPAIIWCDSRAVEIGNKAFHDLSESYCLSHFLNSPGNFTASKLKWVQQNEPSIHKKIHKAMLPGDYIALKLTGEARTTNTGLSEGIFWDFTSDSLSNQLLNYFGFDSKLICDQVEVFSAQGKLCQGACDELGLSSETLVSYRAGDQPNNAFALGALHPGEAAANGGTSGVIYSVTDQNSFDSKSRVNIFLHVNHQRNKKRNGILLCINGTGILNSWLRKTIGGSYEKMNELASTVEIGSDGLQFIPFGNGAERILENKIAQASMHGIDFNRHSQAHLSRAAQEGIAFAFNYGAEILSEMNVKTQTIKAGHANLFLSPVFREAFVNSLNLNLELFDTNGAIGAALGAGVGAGIYSSFDEALSRLTKHLTVVPEKEKTEKYQQAYSRWKSKLNELKLI